MAPGRWRWCGDELRPVEDPRRPGEQAQRDRVCAKLAAAVALSSYQFLPAQGGAL